MEALPGSMQSMFLAKASGIKVPKCLLKISGADVPTRILKKILKITFFSLWKTENKSCPVVSLLTPS